MKSEPSSQGHVPAAALEEYFAGELSDATTEAVELHLDACDACAELGHQLFAASETVAAWDVSTHARAHRAHAVTSTATNSPAAVTAVDSSSALRPSLADQRLPSGRRSKERLAERVLRTWARLSPQPTVWALAASVLLVVGGSWLVGTEISGHHAYYEPGQPSAGTGPVEIGAAHRVLRDSILYEAPSSAARERSPVANGTVVTAIRQEDGWVEVHVGNGLTGWLRASDIGPAGSPNPSGASKGGGDVGSGN